MAGACSCDNLPYKFHCRPPAAVVVGGISDCTMLSYQTSSPELFQLVLKQRSRQRRRLETMDTSNLRPQSKPSPRASYHPWLFTLITCSALAELGLTAFLVCAGNEHHTWPSPRYHALWVLSSGLKDLRTDGPPFSVVSLILFVFNAAWTTLFSTAYVLWFIDGATHFLANIASSVVWLLLTSVLWV